MMAVQAVTKHFASSRVAKDQPCCSTFIHSRFFDIQAIMSFGGGGFSFGGAAGNTNSNNNNAAGGAANKPFSFGGKSRTSRMVCFL